MNTREALTAARHFLIDLIYPPLCLHCGETLLGKGESCLCSECTEMLSHVADNACWFCSAPQGRYSPRPKHCDECKQQDHAFTRIVAACNYDEIARSLIHAFKFHNQKNVSGFICREMNAKFLNEYSSIHFDYILPVPLHRRKLAERGYNQSAVIAQKLSELNHGIYNPNILHRVRYTLSQSLLSAEERKTNLQQAFAVTRPLTGRTILLIDDVFTTGSTVNECARTLRAAGARRIYVMVFAR